jgi:archaellum component FlaC
MHTDFQLEDAAVASQQLLDNEREQLHIYLDGKLGYLNNYVTKQRATDTAKELEQKMATVMKLIHTAIDIHVDDLAAEVERRQSSVESLKENLNELLKNYDTIVSALKQACSLTNMKA